MIEDRITRPTREIRTRPPEPEDERRPCPVVGGKLCEWADYSNFHRAPVCLAIIRVCDDAVEPVEYEGRLKRK